MPHLVHTTSSPRSDQQSFSQKQSTKDSVGLCLADRCGAVVRQKPRSVSLVVFSRRTPQSSVLPSVTQRRYMVLDATCAKSAENIETELAEIGQWTPQQMVVPWIIQYLTNVRSATHLARLAHGRCTMVSNFMCRHKDIFASHAPNIDQTTTLIVLPSSGTPTEHGLVLLVRRRFLPNGSEIVKQMT